MKPYNEHYHIPVTGMLILLLLSIPLGIFLGVLSYYVSTMIYLHFVFPLVIGFVALLAFTILIKWSKIRYRSITAAFGLLMSISLAISFYATPYTIEKNNFIKDVQQEYQVDKKTASNSLDKYLKEETGSMGLLGYMKIRAEEGESYTNYFVINAMPVNVFSYTIRSTWAWIYWIIETILFTLPVLIFGRGKSYFSITANEWYGNQDQLGSIAIENKSTFFERLKINDTQGICDLIIPEDQATHPTLELYTAQAKKDQGEVLLLIKETAQVKPTKVARKLISDWEISQNEFQLFKNELIRKKKP